MRVLAGSPGQGEGMAHGDAGWPQSLPDVHALLRRDPTTWSALVGRTSPLSQEGRGGERGREGTASLKLRIDNCDAGPFCDTLF